MAKSVVVFGATGAGRTGNIPRAGLDLTFMSATCRDSCSGGGLTLGVINPQSDEYFAGIAVGAAYFGSVWMDLTARMKQGEMSAVALTWGFGFFIMAYLGGGIDLEDHRPFGELGLTLKLPVEL